VAAVNSVRMVGVALGIAAATGCSSGTVIGTPFEFYVAGSVVGASPTDIWWWAPYAQMGTSGEAGDYVDALWRYHGGWAEVPVPAEMESRDGSGDSEVRVLSAADGELWFVRALAGGTMSVLRVDTSGATIDDRSADFAPFTGPPSLVQAKGGAGGAFVGAPTTDGTTWYRFDGSAFVPIAESPGAAQVIAVAGADAAYFMVTTYLPDYQGASTELYEYNAGIWTLPGGNIASNGSYVIPTGTGDTWIAPGNPTDMVVSVGHGASWSQIQVTGYTSESTDGGATLWPFAWSVAGNGDLAVLSRVQEPAKHGGDWAEQAWVSGTIGRDGAYGHQSVVVPNENCDPTCFNTLTFVDGFGPARLDDGSAVLEQIGEETVDSTLIVWQP
jgi:hypothetical protein